MPQRVLIVDSGLRNEGGHNFAYTRAVQLELQRRGHDVDVFTHKHATADVARTEGFHAVFSVGTYDYPPGNGPWRDLLYLYAQSVLYRDELERALRGLEREPDLVFCHTVGDFELIGWNRLVARTRFGGRLSILQRLTPRFGTAARWKLRLHPYWRIKPRYLNRLRAKLGPRFQLLTDSDVLSEDFRRIYPHRITTLPIPLTDRLSCDPACPAGNHDGAREPANGTDVIRLGYLGDARPAKGFPLLPALVRAVLEADARVRFVIQCPGVASAPEGSQAPAGVAELAHIAREVGDRVVLVTERLSADDYLGLLRGLDVIVLPYMDRNFVEGTSNVFAEAVALGKPVIVPRGTWMDRELSRSGGGLEFETGDVTSMKDRCLELVRDLDAYACRARRFSAEWRGFHNAQTLVDLLLSTE